MEEELHFSNRFEEGYDLYDPKYEAWLKINHPDAVNKCSTNVFLPIMSSTSMLPHASSPVSAAVYRSLSSNHLYTPSTPTSFHSTLLIPSVSKSHTLDAKQNKTGRAGVLTSTECLRLLKEKEEKKKQVELAKERRKQERELKKQQREEEQKRKAEAKAQKATERQALKAKKEAAKAEKEAARIEKAKNKVQNSPFKARSK